MRNRDIMVKSYLSESEYENLLNLCEKTGCNRSQLIRHLLEGYVLPEKPSRELFDAINKLYNVAGKLDYTKSSEDQRADVEKLKVIANIVIDEMRKDYLLPHKFDV